MLWQVELPLASNVIVAGIRTATVITVGAKAGETYGSKLGYPVKCHLSYDEAKVADFDGVIVPGGYAPDHIRRL